ncbi:putative maltose permease [Annulohypoxylon truncatum]|uniref:putative maltose permease n=1 Tax=Annulohypoxylon truncatum TaxID=327061 RepID=UPI002008CE4A|nr:putative maltose permease [Annulohypoxylon truncatum]KAI1206086.1 putative maltose permease [Annulohypoxylon truncatum]
MAPDQEKSWGVRDHWKAMIAMTLVSLSSFQYGLDFGIIGGLQAMVPFLQVFGKKDPSTPLGYNIQADRQQLIASLMVLGAFVSSSSTGFTAKYIGRKMSLIQESVPSRYRGLGISFFSYWISFGSLIGTIVDNFAAKNPTRDAYVIPLGIVYIVPGILAIGLFFIPESPRWLAARGNFEKAEQALQRLRPRGWAVGQEIEEMRTTLEAEARLQAGIGYLDLFRNPIDRRRTTVAVLALTSQAASGSMYVISYGTYFFEMANVGNAFENSCILTGVGVAALLATALLITKFGRRRVMMLMGFAFCGLSQLIIAVIYTIHPNTENSGKALVGMSVLYIVAYNAMVAPYAWLSGGELSSQRLRSHTFGLATGVGFFFAWLTTFTAPYFINPDALNWGPKYGYIWTGSSLIAGVWIYFFLPEVKDRTLEEIDEMFEARISARKFRKYHCTGSHAVLEEKTQAEYVEETVGSAKEKETRA